MALSLNGVTYVVEIVRRKPRLVLSVNGRDYELGEWSADSVSALVIDGNKISVARALDDEGARETCFVRIDGRTHEIGLMDLGAESAGQGSAGDEIHAPMPGAIIAVHKQEGDMVVRGETIITIESMKLQTALTAPRDGQLSQILRALGDTFDKDELLVRLVPADKD